jgi:O-antigen/teichoic acid export membrane protein
LGKPLLWLFGPQFVVGYDIMFVLAFVMNVTLCIALVPRFGGHGAAAATSISLVFETVLLFWIVRWRLGLHVLAFGKPD